MKTIIAFVCLGLSLGLYFGRSSSEPMRHLASEEKSHSAFLDLPCPTEEEFLELARRTKLKLPESPYACDESPKSKLARVLHFMNQLKIDVPENWGGEARETLVDPLEYVIKMAASISVDFTQADSIAQNFRLTGDVFLGGLFFQIEPLFSVAVLIHEARHSEDSSPGHDRCRSGDIPKSEGGCDAKFSIGKDAGAYAYGAIFEIGLAEYAQGLSKADREYLTSLAVVHMASRFNEIPPEFGAPVDVVLVLDEEGQVYVVNPYHWGLSKIDLPEGKKVRKIEYSPRGAASFLFTEDHDVFVWSPSKGLEKTYEDLIQDLPGVQEIDKIISGVSRNTKTFVISTENDFYYIDTEKKTGNDILTRYQNRPEEKVKKLTIGNGWSSFFLTEQGEIMTIVSNHRGMRGTKFYTPYSIFTGPKWQQIHGGVTYDQLFAIDESGALFFEGPSKDRSGLGPVASNWEKGALTKYLEGTNFRAYLTKEGKLFLSHYQNQNSDPQEINIEHPKKIVDFTLPRKFLFSDAIVSVPKTNELDRICGAKVSFVDPILGKPMGVRSNGEIVYGSTCELAGKTNLGPIRVIGEAFSKETKGYAPVRIEIGERQIVPYFPRFQK